MTGSGQWAVGGAAALRKPIWRGLCGLLVTLVVALALALPAAAAKPKFAAIAVDARNGKVLYASDADGLRYPASLTKVMTLYVLFQDLKAKRVKLDSKFRMSARAASMAPTKLGLRPGQTITVDQAIRALVTKSANDVAAMVAENLAGSEAAFAARMTRTAKSIGMSRSTFHNASGLPNPRQWTTARDMATLSLRIQRDFPQYYPYFRITSFTYAGRTIKTHNKLLGRYAGTDGIKTGYIRASGFNLTSSAQRGGKRVVGVVLGATSSGSRNKYMMGMLDRAFPKCTNGKSIAASIGNAVPREPIETAGAPEEPAPPKTPNFASKAKTPQPALAEAEPTDDAKIRGLAEEQEEIELTTAAVEEHKKPEPSTIPFEVKTPERVAMAGGHVIVAPHSWIIQVGAYPTAADADSQLQMALGSGVKELEGKQRYTMEAESNGATVYRARFGGFSKQGANSTCTLLKRKGIGCLALAPQS